MNFNNPKNFLTIREILIIRKNLRTIMIWFCYIMKHIARRKCNLWMCFEEHFRDRLFSAGVVENCLCSFSFLWRFQRWFFFIINIWMFYRCENYGYRIIKNEKIGPGHICVFSFQTNLMFFVFFGNLKNRTRTCSENLKSSCAIRI